MATLGVKRRIRRESSSSTVTLHRCHTNKDMRSQITSRLLIPCTLFFSPNPTARSQCLRFSKSSSSLRGFVTMATAAAEEFVKGSVHPNGVAVITLDRPKALNAMNLGFVLSCLSNFISQSASFALFGSGWLHLIECSLLKLCEF